MFLLEDDTGCACSLIDVMLAGNPKNYHVSCAGKYNLEGSVNGRKYWLQTGGARAIWFSNKKWRFGYLSKLGQDYSSIRTISTPSQPTCPYDESNNKDWEYYISLLRKYADDEHGYIKVTCSGK